MFLLVRRMGRSGCVWEDGANPDVPGVASTDWANSDQSRGATRGTRETPKRYRFVGQEGENVFERGAGNVA